MNNIEMVKNFQFFSFHFLFDSTDFSHLSAKDRDKVKLKFHHEKKIVI